MRAYTLTILAQCTQSGDSLPADKDIVAWVNHKLQSSGKSSSIRSFQDPSISNAVVVLDLIDSIKPKVIDHALVGAAFLFSLVKTIKNASWKKNSFSYTISQRFFKIMISFIKIWSFREKSGSLVKSWSLYFQIKSGDSFENKLANAKYAITCGRKIGAKIYALPEDIVEVREFHIFLLREILYIHFLLN